MIKIKAFVRDTLRTILGKKGYTFIRFLITHKYILSFTRPKTFSEKIIYRKFNTSPSEYSKYVDKYVVREFVENTIGDKYLIPLIKKVAFLKPEDFITLPRSFVIKTSNGGGGNNVLIVEDKNEIDIKSICEQFNSYLKIKVGQPIDELFYDVEKPCIIIEKLIKHQNGKFPSDYKCHIFKEKNNLCVYIQVDTDRFEKHKRSIFDENLELQNFQIQPKYPEVDSGYVFPDNMKELITLAKKLAEDFSYVRVDMYNVDGIIYFGEMTFCHGSGWEPVIPKSADIMLGDLWGEYK